MRYILRIVIILAIFGLASPGGNLNAQTRVNVWLRSSTRIYLACKLSAEAEFQLRRQEDKAAHQLAYPLMYSARTYLHYDVNKALRVSLSPFAWFEHFPLKADGHLSKMYEYRSTLAAVWTANINKKMKLFVRPAVEYRVFSNSTEQLRPRLQAGMKWQVSKWLAIRPYEEIMAAYTTDRTDLQYDQNRIGTGIILHTTKRTQLELGYIHICRSNTSDENIFLNFYYNIGK